MRRNSRSVTFQIVMSRTILIPPLVLPEHAPMAVMNVKGSQSPTGHSMKFSVVKPVVVISAVTWKAPDLMASGTSLFLKIIRLTAQISVMESKIVT